MKSTFSQLSYRPIIAAAIGTTLEFFNFCLFGFLVPIFAPLFFPANHHFYPVLYGYAVFAIGYLCKPIGAIIFGYFGDRFGRRTALSSSLFLMAFTTMILGLLPTYASIGFWAPLLLLITRMLQGISAGGEIAGGILFAIEHTDIRYRGVAGGIFNSIATGGGVLGSLVGFLCTLPMMPFWIWRIPFLLGVLLCFVGFYLRKYIPETPEFNSIKKNEIVRFPLLKGLKNNYVQFIFVLLSGGYGAVVFHVNFVYLPVFFGTLPNISENFARLSGTISLWCLVITLPIFGYLSDKIGRTTLMLLGTVFLSLNLMFFFQFDVLSPAKLIVEQIIFAICLSMFNGPWCALAVEIFDKRFRYSCLGFGNTLADAVFGGTTPLIATLLMETSHNGCNLLTGYIVLWALLGFLAVWKVRNYSIK